MKSGTKHRQLIAKYNGRTPSTAEQLNIDY